MSIIGLAFGGGFTVGPIIGTFIIYIIDKLQWFHGSYLIRIAFIAGILNIFNYFL